MMVSYLEWMETFAAIPFNFEQSRGDIHQTVEHLSHQDEC